MNSTLQFIQTTPEALAELINEGVQRSLDDFRKNLNTPSNPDELLTREQTCQLLQIDSSTLWAWTNKGKVIAYGIANRRYYKKSELLASLVPLRK